MLTIIVLALVGITVAVDLVPGIKNKSKKDIAVYCLILSAAFGILFLFSLDVKVPGPSEPIRSVVEAIFPVKK